VSGRGNIDSKGEFRESLVTGLFFKCSTLYTRYSYAGAPSALSGC